MEKLNSIKHLTENNLPKDILNHYIRHYLCLIEHMCYCTELEKKLPYTKDEFAVKTKKAIKQIEPTCELIDHDKSKVIKGFCKFMQNTSENFDNVCFNEEYSKEIYEKFDEIKEMLNAI